MDEHQPIHTPTPENEPSKDAMNETAATPETGCCCGYGEAGTTSDSETAPHKKNPVGAAVLSLIFPGLGFFYAENYYKGFAFLLTLISLIKLAADSEGRVEFILMSVGFYLFQIFDTFNTTEKLNNLTKDALNAEKSKLDLTFSIALASLGLLLLLANLGIITSFSFIGKLWPVILIAIGVYQIINYYNTKKNIISKE